MSTFPKGSDSIGSPQAESFTTENLMRKTLNVQFTPHWINGEDRFWLKQQTADGHQFIVVDATNGDKTLAFDHVALAKALSSAGEKDVSAESFPICDLRFLADAIEVTLTSKTLSKTTLRGFFVETAMIELRKIKYRYDVYSAVCTLIDARSVNSIAAPEGNREVYIRDHNLWLRDLESGVEKALTLDGLPHFSYGAWDEAFQDTSYTVRRRFGQALAPQYLQWSPDGRFIAAMRVDLRDTESRPVLTEFTPDTDDFMVTNTRHYPLISDPKDLIRTISIIDTTLNRVVMADINPALLHDRVPSNFNGGCLWWNMADGTVHLVTASKDARSCGLVAIDLETGKTRAIVNESEDQHYIFAGTDVYSTKPDMYVTSDGAEAIWYSQRSGYGHLYLYDAQTGAFKNPITQGNWVVSELIRVDEVNRKIYFYAVGKEPRVNPYYKHLYCVDFDGGDLTLLTPENADHNFRSALTGSPRSFNAIFSPSGRYFLDTYSMLSQEPHLVIRHNNGELVSHVMTADISGLKAIGWQPPQAFVVKAADQKTDLHGVMYRPKDFNGNHKYPIVEYTYPGPQGRYAPSSFMEGLKKDLQSIAELGFVVVYLDGRGTAGRDKSFRYAFLHTEDPFGAEDHKAAIENLALQYSYMDITRVGVLGESYGGYGALHAASLYPDFFKVCISIAGSHDFRASGNSSLLRLFGAPGTPGKDHYHAVSNTRLAGRLQAKLFLIYGELDLHVRLNQYFLMSQALIEADKDFDLLIVPNADHSVGQLPYVRRRWKDFLVKHLIT